MTILPRLGRLITSSFNTALLPWRPSTMSSAVFDNQAEAGPSRRSPSPPPLLTTSPVVELSSLGPPGVPIHSKPSSWDFYRNTLGSPKYIVAPMVTASELPWRLLSRDLGADLCYSPMINSQSLSNCLNAKSKGAKDKQLAWYDVENGEEGHGKDSMVIAQLAGHDPDVVLQCAEYVQDHCLAVDLNLGCPQRIAKRGRYGAFLQEDWPLIFSIINKLHVNLKIPVTAKMRVFPDTETTVAYAKMLQYAGAQIITVHGRTREQKGHKTGLADWDKIRAVKQALDVPVFANGNILYGEDLAVALEKTGADGIMSAEGNLFTPSIFSSPELRNSLGTDLFPYQDDKDHPEWSALPYIPRMATMYLDAVVHCKTRTAPVAVKGHMFKICKPALDKYRDLMIMVGQAQIKKGDWSSKENREEALKPYRLAVKALEERLEVDRKDASYLTAPVTEHDQTKMPPEYRYVPHWLCQPYFRPPLPDNGCHDGTVQKQANSADVDAETQAGAGGMIDPHDEQSQGEKRLLDDELQAETTAQDSKRIREELQSQLTESQDLKQRANALFAKGEYEEACEKWVDAIGVLPPVPVEVQPQSQEDKEQQGTTATEAEQPKIAELTADEAEQMMRELELQDEDGDAQVVKGLQSQQRELRTTLWSNVAEARLRLQQWKMAVEACNNALETTPSHLKSLSRRATANEHLNTASSLTDALADLRVLQQHHQQQQSHSSPSASSLAPSQRATISRVEAKQRSALEKEKDEMLDKLKGLGNSLLGRFGLSTDNFKFEQNEGGSWGMKFQR